MPEQNASQTAGQPQTVSSSSPPVHTTNADFNPLFCAVRSHEAAMIEGDSEALHHYRRQLRRLRSWLGLLARLQPELRLDEVRNLLRQMMMRAASNRDRQVAASLLQQRAQSSDNAAALHHACKVGIHPHVPATAQDPPPERA